MKYFTPERLARLQDRSGEPQFLAALDEWERAAEDYRQQLNDIQHRLRAIRPRPPDWLKFLTTASLHDAQVLDLDSGGHHRFRITLQPHFLAERWLTLTYHLTQQPQTIPNSLPERLCSEPISWLYDELALGDCKSEGEMAFRHTILFSDGREVGLCFRDIAIEPPVSLVSSIPIDSCPP